MHPKYRLFIMLEQVNAGVKKLTADGYADVHCVHDWRVDEGPWPERWITKEAVIQVPMRALKSDFIITEYEGKAI